MKVTIQSNTLSQKRKNEWKLYVSNGNRIDYFCIIMEIHGMYRHPGFNKTMKLLQECFTFDKLIKQMKKYVRCHEKCQRFEDNSRPKL